jgi:SpoIID/LytB domain protein
MNKIAFTLFSFFYIFLSSRLIGCEINSHSLKNNQREPAIICKEIYDVNIHNISVEKNNSNIHNIANDLPFKIDIIEDSPYSSPLPAPPVIPQGGRIIKIGLYQNLKEFYIGCDGDYSINRDKGGEIIIQKNQVLSIKIPETLDPNSLNRLDPNSLNKEVIRVKPKKRNNILNVVTQNSSGNYSQKGYRGTFQLFLNPKGTITVVNEMSLNEYVAGVVPYEVPSSFPMEALKTQAIVARTYTLKHVKRHEAEGFDLCATQHCQVYGGIENETDGTDQAVEETIHKMVFYGNSLADTLYHSTCGGLTANVENIWQTPPVDYLKSATGQINPVSSTFLSEETFKTFIDNPTECFCQESKMFRWERSYKKQELQELISQGLPVVLNKQVKLGELIDLSVEERSPEGRVKTLLIKGSEGEYRVEKDKIRWLTSKGKISKDALPSTLFYISKTEENTFHFKGGGWGHGIGLCQFCAKGMANHGMTAVEIIKHFYPGCTLEYPLWYSQ